jgi:aspartate racemase
MRTIGVLGGLGPQATVDFEEHIHRVSQRLIPQKANFGYPPMVVFYLRHAPVLVGEDFQPLFPLRPDPRLLEAARQLGQLADFLVITANGPHLLQAEIEQASGKKVLSMIAEALEEVKKRDLTRVGLIAFGEPVVYQAPLEQLGIPTIVLTEELRARVDQAVVAVWEGRVTPADLRTVREAVEFLRAEGADGIILGCTEIPLLLGEITAQADLINPTERLAEAAVRQALAGEGDHEPAGNP